jgi:hypothetical protein
MHRLSEASVRTLERDYSDLIESGGMEQRAALKAEANEPELAELPRLVFKHRKGDFGRLRELINAVNRAQLESPVGI